MKSMQQMGLDLLNAAHWDGTFPKAVILGFPPVVALAHDEKEYEELIRRADFCFKLALIGLILCMALIPVALYLTN